MRPLARVRRRGEAGYTLLIVTFLVASMAILLTAATPSILTEGRREREEEMIWRGNQYVRAIGLYYRKTGHYPTKIDDLYKGVNGDRFLREEYKDPMNTTDGSWRLIYLGPNGQLIGSVNYQNLLQMSMGGATPLGAQGSASTGATPQNAATFGIPGNGQANAGGAGQPPATPPNAGAGQDQSEPEESPIGGEIVGGNLIGIGSKVKIPSIKTLNGATDYYHWEFIWKPIVVVGAPTQPPAAGAPGTAAPAGAPGAAPPGGPLDNMPPEGEAPPSNPPDQPPSDNPPQNQ